VIAEDELYGIEVFHFLQQVSEPENQIIGKRIQPNEPLQKIKCI
jgi:hypothetical protein